MILSLAVRTPQSNGIYIRACSNPDWVSYRSPPADDAPPRRFGARLQGRAQHAGCCQHRNAETASSALKHQTKWKWPTHKNARRDHTVSAPGTLFFARASRQTGCEVRSWRAHALRQRLRSSGAALEARLERHMQDLDSHRVKDEIHTSILALSPKIHSLVDELQKREETRRKRGERNEERPDSIRVHCEPKISARIARPGPITSRR